MYEDYYGLKGDPFRISPDGRDSFEHSSYRKARSYLEYAFFRGEGTVLITGQPGTGKTTLIKSVARNLPKTDIDLTVFSCEKLDADGLIRRYASELDVHVDRDDVGSLLVGIGKRLLELNRQGTKSVLALDEAQSLTIDALEQARLLTNYQVNDKQLLQVVLLGQPELRDKILSPSLVQLHQRITSSSTLTVLNQSETRDYFIHQLNSVDWNGNPDLHEDIFKIIHRASAGIPRWINQIGSRVMLHCMIEEKNEITASDVRKVVVDLVDEYLLPTSVRTEQIRIVAGGGSGLLDSEF